MSEDGGPAFPCKEKTYDPECGMSHIPLTKHEEQAIGGIARHNGEEITEVMIRYAKADEMLAQRVK
jgi:chaperone required for assembly of F1-ATPase